MMTIDEDSSQIYCKIAGGIDFMTVVVQEKDNVALVLKWLRGPESI